MRRPDSVNQKQGKSQALGALAEEPSKEYQSEKKADKKAFELELLALRQRLVELESENHALQQQNQQLRERISTNSGTDKERAEFISNVAHELRSPLTSIKGYIDLMLEGETGELNELQSEFLGVVGANAEKLARIITDMLDVSRLESGRLSFKPFPLDLGEIVRAAAEDIQPQLKAKQIHFEMSLPSSHGAEEALQVNADRDKLFQAIRVLLSNSTRYTRSGGLVNLALRLSSDGTRATIMISDGSPRIEPHEIPKVFTKFWMPNDTAWRENGSPGLGLAIVKSITELHDGTVSVVPRPEGGNTFSLTLPLINQPVIELDREVPEQTQKAALVISQNPEFCGTAEKLLQSAGFQVVATDNREEVFSSRLAWKPDLILEGYCTGPLPGETPDIPATPNTGGIPVFYLQLTKTEQQAIAAGALAVLAWPSPEDSLLSFLTQVLAAEITPEKLEEFKQNQNVLLVSPANNTLRALDKLLHDAGYQHVYRATMEHDAINLGRRYRPGLLLVDLTSEDGRNPGLLEELREERLFQQTPAIALVSPEQVAAPVGPNYQPRVSGSEKLGSDAYTNLVPKPFLRRRFLGLVQRLTSGADR